RVPLLGNLFKSRRSSKTKRQLMVFLRPIILRDAATEAAVSNEKYNFLRAEQLRMRENRELRFREQQPVLPPLPDPQDLIRNPPPPPRPVDERSGSAEPAAAPARAPRRVPGHP